jgi:endonuclease YncB( thermonuclease family)
MPRIAVILACLPAAATEPRTFTGKFVGVQDCDTLHVLDDAKQEHTIRLDGIDAAERKQAFGTGLATGSRRSRRASRSRCRLAHEPKESRLQPGLQSDDPRVPYHRGVHGPRPRSQRL